MGVPHNKIRDFPPKKRIKGVLFPYLTTREEFQQYKMHTSRILHMKKTYGSGDFDNIVLPIDEKKKTVKGTIPHLDVEVHEVVLVKNFKAQQGLSEKGVDVGDLETLFALQLLLQGCFTELGLDVQTLVLDPRLKQQQQQQQLRLGSMCSERTIRGGD